MPRAESGDERRDCVTLWAVQLRRASAVAESTLGVTGMTGHRPTFLPGALPAPYAWRHAAGRRRARGRGQRTRVCGWPGYTAGDCCFTIVVKSGGGMRMFKFPLSNPAVRPRRISFTDTGSSIRFVGGLAWRRYALSNLPGRSRSACRPGRGRGPHTPSIFCQSSSLRA